jgi:hypothetical protein
MFPNLEISATITQTPTSANPCFVSKKALSAECQKNPCLVKEEPAKRVRLEVKVLLSNERTNNGYVLKNGERDWLGFGIISLE